MCLQRLNGATARISTCYQSKVIWRFNNIFEHTHYLNNRDRGIELFDYFNKKYPNKKIYVTDCLYRKLHSYDKQSKYDNEKTSTEFAEILYNIGLIDLVGEYVEHEYVVGELIKAGWFKIALEYVKKIKTLNYGKILFKDKYKDDVLSAIRLHSDDTSVIEIISLLELEDTYTTLIVKEYVDDGYDSREIEIKKFKNINDARSYVIKEYGISFEYAAKDVTYWRKDDNEDLYFELE